MKSRTWLALSLLVSAITWLYAARILRPWNDYAGQRSELRAQMWDLYPRWVGARELLLHGVNPYGPEVSHEIQMAFYGHIVSEQDQEKNRAAGRKLVDEQRFAYPVYVVFLMAPLIHADFSTVKRWAPAVLAVLAALCVPLCLGILDWRLPWTAVAAITLFTVSSPPIVQGMHHQQLSILVGLLLFAGAWCVRKERLIFGGVFLAWSTIKPQMAFFPLCFFLIWVTGDWRKRWKLLAGFLAALAALIGSGEMILPGWVHDFVEGAMAYRRYFPTTSLLRVALGDMLGELLGGIILIGVLVFGWRKRTYGADSPQFLDVFAAFLIATILGFPLLTPLNQALLILPALLVLRDWDTLPKFSRLIFIVSLSWPWIISLLLLLFPPRLDSPNETPLLPLLLVSFFPLFLSVLLMTRRRTIVEFGSSHTDPQLG
jgi:hypothetical protein